MAKLKKINVPEEKDRKLDLIFVHGLGGDHRSTWEYEDKGEKNFWPAWLSEDLPDIGVWSLDYEASPSEWKGYSMPLLNRAEDCLDCFDLEEKIGQRPIGFVCHSLGGLLVKTILRVAKDNGKEDWLKIVNRTQFILFLSTPHHGSELADWIIKFGKILRPSISIEELKADNSTLEGLNKWYKNNADKLGITTFVYYESLETKGKLISELVVSRMSADPSMTGVDPIKIDKDHKSICKMSDKNEQVYLRVKKLVTDTLSKSNEPEPELLAESCALLLLDKNTFYDEFRKEIIERIPDIKHLDPKEKDRDKTNIEKYKILVNEFLDSQRKWLITIYPDDNQKIFYLDTVFKSLHDNHEKKIIFIESGSDLLDLWKQTYQKKDKKKYRSPPFFPIQTNFKEAAIALVNKIISENEEEIKKEDPEITVVFLYPNVKPAKDRATEFEKFLAGIVRQSPASDDEPEDNYKNLIFKKINLVQLSMGGSWLPNRAIELINSSVDIIKPLLKDKKVFFICGNDDIALSIFENLDILSDQGVVFVGFDGFDDDRYESLKDNGHRLITAKINVEGMCDHIKRLLENKSPEGDIEPFHAEVMEK